MKTWIECRAYPEVGAKLCSTVNDALFGMSKRAEVVSVSIVTDHEDSSTLVYFVLREKT